VKLSYLNLTTTDPAHNLAVEEYVFEKLPRDRMYFMLWQNDNAIIIGKHQNTLAEINETYVREHGIRVVRRLSGGGAVYHDLGNLNFTFITDAKEQDKLNFKLFCQPVVQALAAIGVRAEINGRNDITIDGRKFSGNSQYVKEGRVMHHGTILFRSDLDVVNHALKVDPEKIKAKGIQSVRSRVTNVCEYLQQDISLEQFRVLFLRSLLQAYPGEEYVLTEQDLAAVAQLRQERYDTWQWNYGVSPACTLLRKARIEGCGTVEVYLTVNHGRVENAQFRGDFFSVKEPEMLAKLLVGCRPGTGDYAAALKDVNTEEYFTGMKTEQFLHLLEQ